MFIIGGVTITNEDDVYIRGEKVNYMYIKNVKIYEAMSALQKLLRDADKINRYKYNSTTVAIFDSAYEEAQLAVREDENKQQLAYDNLYNAIVGLIEVTFTITPKTWNSKVGISLNLMTRIKYDGIGDITFKSSNEEVVILDGSIATAKKAGMTVILIMATDIAPLGLTVTVTN